LIGVNVCRSYGLKSSVQCPTPSYIGSIAANGFGFTPQKVRFEESNEDEQDVEEEEEEEEEEEQQCGYGDETEDLEEVEEVEEEGLSEEGIQTETSRSEPVDGETVQSEATVDQRVAVDENKIGTLVDGDSIGETSLPPQETTSSSSSPPPTEESSLSEPQLTDASLSPSPQSSLLSESSPE